MEKKPVSYFVAGTILGMVSIVLFLAYYYAGIAFDKNFLAWIPTLISVGLIIYFIVAYSNVHHHNVTYGTLFGYGFRTTVIWTLIVIVFTALFLYIFPDYKEKFIEQMTLQLDQRSDLSESSRETALSMTQKYFNISVIGGSLFTNLFIGTIASLLGAAIAKKNPATPFNQTI